MKKSTPEIPWDLRKMFSMYIYKIKFFLKENYIRATVIIIALKIEVINVSKYIKLLSKSFKIEESQKWQKH